MRERETLAFKVKRIIMTHLHAFVISPGSSQFSQSFAGQPLQLQRCRRVSRRPSTRSIGVVCASRSPSPRRISWAKTLVLAATSVLSTTLPSTAEIRTRSFTPDNTVATSASETPAGQEATGSSVVRPIPRRSVAMASAASSEAIPLNELGIKRNDYMSERELRRRKTTQFSEAEQEIMELEEWEVHTQWFRDLQMFWTALASIGGIFVLYKGGVMWENWIKEQERKDMEEEIELTGTFIDPRAVRKDDEDNPGKGPAKKSPDGGKPGKGPSGSDSGKGSDQDEWKPGDVESLEKLFGKS